MGKKDLGKVIGTPVTFQIPSPAGGVQMETYIPWTLVKRGVRRKVITPFDTPIEALRRFHTVDIRVAEAGAGTLA